MQNGNDHTQTVQRTAAEIITALGSSLESGLTMADAALRLRKDGPNDIPEKKSHPFVGFALKFWGLSAWMIELIAILSFILGKYVDFWIALALLMVNALLSFFEEQRASGAVTALRNRLQVSGRVLRDHIWQLLPARELVCGDVIRVRAGDFVPADAQIVDGSLEIDQSALTGESRKIEKLPNATISSGSIVKQGEATAVVIATGIRTYYGRTTQLVESARPKLHIEKVIARVVRWLVLIIGLQVILVMMLSFLKGIPLLEILPLCLVLLMSAIPVALPVMFTVSMALGSMELGRRGVLVTRLSTTEAAAHMDILCADKTGTLTLNQLALAGTLPQPGFSEDDVLGDGGLASNEADQDPIDLAFLRTVQDRHLWAREEKTLSFMPFSPKTRRTEAVIERDGQRYRVTKGALRVVATASGLHEAEILALENKADEEAKKGVRVIAVARAEGDGPLQFIGMAFFYDAPRPDSSRLIGELKELGVRVKMLTGDALPIAQETARSLGLGKIIRMPDLRAEEHSSAAGTVSLSHDSDGFAEVYPEDKFFVVKNLQNRGHMVGMTGDGVNDAPALRQAEIGIAVSGATDVAKSAAGVVLTTQGLEGIVDLIKNGRAIYQRVLSWLFNKLSGAVLKSGVVVIAFLVTGKFVISALGMMLLLFMTDFVKISLSTDNVRPSQEPETWNIAPLVKVSVLLGLLMLVESLFFLAIGWSYLDFDTNTSVLQACTFQIFLFFALFSVFSIRERRFFWSSWPSVVLGIALAFDGAVGILIGVWGLSGMQALPFADLVCIIGYTCLCALGINDPIKAAFIQRFWFSSEKKLGRAI